MLLVDRPARRRTVHPNSLRWWTWDQVIGVQVDLTHRRERVCLDIDGGEAGLSRRSWHRPAGCCGCLPAARPAGGDRASRSRSSGYRGGGGHCGAQGAGSGVGAAESGRSRVVRRGAAGRNEPGWARRRTACDYSSPWVKDADIGLAVTVEASAPLSGAGSALEARRCRTVDGLLRDVEVVPRTRSTGMF
jgi:hypothetical protein